MPLLTTLPALQEIPEQLPPAPLPDPIAAAVRFLFNLPSFLQIAGLVVGATALLAAAGATPTPA